MSKCEHDLIGTDVGICVFDFCGRWDKFYPFQYWADWCTECKVVKFGNFANKAPDWQIDHAPNDDEIGAYLIKELGEGWQKQAIKDYLAEDGDDEGN